MWAQASGRHALEHSSGISSQPTAHTHDVLGLHVCSFGWRHGTEPPSECWRLSSLFVQTCRSQKCGVLDPWLARCSRTKTGWMDETEANSQLEITIILHPVSRIPPAWESVLGLNRPPLLNRQNIWTRYYPYHPWDGYIYPAIYLTKNRRDKAKCRQIYHTWMLWVSWFHQFWHASPLLVDMAGCYPEVCAKHGAVSCGRACCSQGLVPCASFLSSTKKPWKCANLRMMVYCSRIFLELFLWAWWSSSLGC